MEMAGSKSDYLECAILDHVLGGDALPWTPPAHVYVALYTVDPTDAGGGTEVTQAGGTLYARVELDNDDVTWPSTGVGAKDNDIEITFPTAGANWGTVTAFGIFDSAIGGANNLLYWGELTVDKAINTGDTAKFAVGDIDITED
jgi:hypothetical protein